MANLTIDVDSVAASGMRVMAAAEPGASLPTTITPAAADPVSAGVAATLQARALGIATYSAAGSQITTSRGQLLLSSASAYADQEASNASMLGRGGGGGGAAGPIAAPPSLSLPMVPPATPPVFAPPPGTGHEIAQLLHAGPGTGGLQSAAQQLRAHGGELRQTADKIDGAAAQVHVDWVSEAGMSAAHRLGELGTWFHEHADQARSLADAIDRHCDSFARVKAAVPTPREFQDVENRLAAAVAANANPANMGRYAPVVQTLQTLLLKMNAQAMQAYCCDYATDSSHQGTVGKPLQPPPSQGTGTPGGDGIVRTAAMAGAGPGPGVPPSIVGGRPAVEQPIYPFNPNGAGPGPGVTGGLAPVSYNQTGAGPGPGAGPGVPPSIVGGGPSVERPIYPLNPNGAMPGPGVTGGLAPVSYHEGAGPGPGAGPGVPPSIVGGTPAVERPIYPLNPNGAMPGPGVTGGVAPV